MSTPAPGGFAPDELDRLLRVARDAAEAGGRVVLEHFGRARDVREKAAGDWVSAADVASEHAVKQCLAEGAAGLAFFGEETGGERAEVGWYVDPLDGTANFLHGLEAVGVSVALVAESTPVVGVVHVPLLSRTYFARLGGGAFRDEQRLSVSERDPARAICATGFPFRRKHLLARFLTAMTAALYEFEDLRRVGAASLDLCWTAEGTFDGYFELGLGTWDVAAGGLIVREAGGVVTDWQGHDSDWLWSGDIVAGPPAVHERLLDLARSADSSPDPEPD